jgi:hypothetical protein
MCTQHEAFAPFRATGKRVRQVIQVAFQAGNPVSKEDGGVDASVSYGAKGICNTNYERKSDHNDGKRARLVGWRSVAFGLRGFGQRNILTRLPLKPPKPRLDEGLGLSTRKYNELNQSYSISGSKLGKHVSKHRSPWKEALKLSPNDNQCSAKPIRPLLLAGHRSLQCYSPRNNRMMWVHIKLFVTQRLEEVGFEQQLAGE